MKEVKTDLQLVNDIRGGNKIIAEKAYAALYKRYYKSIVFHLRRSLREDLASEIATEAFTKMALNIDKFNTDTAIFSTWLFKITQNLTIDKMRRKKDIAISLTDMTTEDDEDNSKSFIIPTSDFNPEEKVIISERNEKIKKIVDSMENKELAYLIELRFFQGMSYEQISEYTQKPIGTIKAFIFRAKQILKTEFEKSKVL